MGGLFWLSRIFFLGSFNNKERKKERETRQQGKLINSLNLCCKNRKNEKVSKALTLISCSSSKNAKEFEAQCPIFHDKINNLCMRYLKYIMLSPRTNHMLSWARVWLELPQAQLCWPNPICNRKPFFLPTLIYILY